MTSLPEHFLPLTSEYQLALASARLSLSQSANMIILLVGSWQQLRRSKHSTETDTNSTAVCSPQSCAVTQPGLLLRSAMFP